MEQEILELLDKKNKFSCLIIDFSQSENDWLSVYSLSLRLDLNQRSIQRYIHELEEKIEEFNLETGANVSIEYNKFKGIKIAYGTSAAFKLKNYIIDNDDTIMLLNQLIFSKISSIKKYSEDNFISEYSLKKSIIRIEELLAGFQIKLSKHKTIFEGLERNIRMFIYIFLWTLYKDSEWPFDYISEEKIYNSVDNSAKNGQLSFTSINRKQMAYLMSVNLLRNKKKYYIKKDAEWDNYVNLEAMKKDPLIIQGMENYQYYLENDIYFLLLLIQMKYRIFKSDLLRERIFSYHQKRNSDVYLMTQEMMNLFEETFFEIPEERKDVFFTYSFCAHLFCRVFKSIRFDIDGYDILVKNDTSPKLLEKLSDFLDQLAEEHDSPIFLEKPFLIRKYFLLFSYFKTTTIYEKKITVGVDSDLPFFIRENIKKDIKRNFENRYNLELVESDEKGIDVILTNMPSLHEEEDYVCVISYPLQNKEYQMIEQTLANIFNDKS
ncbi:helix-turn-helix domain-containing protein [Enterococcus sp. LJL99]